MKSNKLIFRICLFIFATAIIGSVVNSIINYDTVVATFQSLGYPVYLIHLLGVAQIIGLILIVFNRDQFLVEWVYAGFFMNFILGCFAHLAVNSGNGASAVVCIVILLVTYVQSKKARAFKDEIEPIRNPNFTNEAQA
ncbi:hypothetical protein FEE95_11765 [Maribacter algarum]|uniref:DoxX-like family protein n=1 Tax=Maribacter algarum (ex Zhang et al. 2020) TaxID=2578118 RepID=A0A5S3PR21_9FLAO|nr:DoxX family protein [Maribacter algarum]TMM57162.1 hypothetical protein FEE95_11765 [Maribacter algarum]